MRILLVNDYGVLHGGVESHLRALKDRLAGRGHAVRMLASSAGLERQAPSCADRNCLGTTSRFRTVLQSANPWAAAAMRSELAEFRPDVVHLNLFLTQLSPLILPLLKRVPCIYHAHWQRVVCPTGTRMLADGSVCQARFGLRCYRGGCLPPRDWVPLMLQMKLWSRWRHSIDRIVANSEATRARLAEAGLENIELIQYGVLDRPQRPRLQEPPSLAFAGRLVPEKGVEVLLRAFRLVLRNVPDAKLQIAGDGPQMQSLLRLAGALDLSDRVVFHGQLSPEEMERRLAVSWVQVVPSVWEEPFGLVAAEACMRGTAAVVSDHGGLAEIVIHERTGLRVPPGDAEALATALSTLLSDRTLAEEMGCRARIDARSRFSFDDYVERLCALYRQVIEMPEYRRQ